MTKKTVLTWRSFSHFNSCDTARPQITLQEKMPPVKQSHYEHRSSVKSRSGGGSYSVIVRGVWVLVASDDLRCHPIRGPDEGVPPPHCPVELGAHAKVH